MTSRIVLLTGRLVDEERYNERRVALDLNWQHLMQEIGYQILIIPPTSSPDIVFSEIKCAGLVLTGGNDLSSQSASKLSRARDEFERSLLEEAQKFEIPCLAICRGAQLVGETLGFRLGPVENHVAVEHEIKSPTGLKSYERPVNSYHNFGLSQTGQVSPETITLATALDGTVEAFAVPDRKLLAWMWHPERAHTSVQVDKVLMREHFL